MIVYLCRHANAGKKRSDPHRDEKRPLDDAGVTQGRTVGRVLASLGTVVEAVWSSPLKRATQTAALLANEIGTEARVEFAEALRPEADFTAFRELLRRNGHRDSILVVGHNPSLSLFLSRLVAGPGHGVPLPLKKGGVAKVEVEGGRGKLEWMLTPRLAQSFQEISAVSVRPKTRRK